MSLIRQCGYYLLPKEDLPEHVCHHDDLHKNADSVMIGIVRTVSINYWLQLVTLIKEVDLIYVSTSYVCWLMH